MKWPMPLLIVTLFSAACESLEADPNTIPRDQIIDLAASARSLLANGADTTLLSASIPRNSDAELITFETTLGVFDSTGGKNTIRVRARPPTNICRGPALNNDEDKRLVACAILRSSTRVSSSVVVSASVMDFIDRETIEFTRAEADAISAYAEHSILRPNAAPPLDRTRIIAVLRREDDTSVSQGTQVHFSRVPAIGRFVGSNMGTTGAGGTAEIMFAVDTPDVPQGTAINIVGHTSNVEDEFVVELTVK